MTTLTELEKERMAEENIKLVYWVAEKFRNSGYEYDEIVSVGMVGYIQAINTFNPELGMKFSTYVVPGIKYAILNYIDANKKHLKNVSLQQTIYFDKEGNDFKVEDTIADENAVIDKELMLEDIKGELLEAIKVLSEKEKIMVVDYFFHNKTQTKIAEELNCHRSYVSAVIKKSLKKMKVALSSPQLLNRLLIEQGNIKNEKEEQVIAEETLKKYLKADDRDKVDKYLAIHQIFEKLFNTKKEIIFKLYVENKSNEEVAEEMNRSYPYVAKVKQQILVKVAKNISHPLEQVS